MTIIIAAGGTGGHLYPAVALAREFLRREPAAMIVFVGTTRGVESKVLAHEGFELTLITAKPVMGKGALEILAGLSALPAGLWQSWRIVRKRRPDLVIGVGGYTSPAMLAAAALAGVPRVILEPNAYPGMANKVVAPFADRVFVAFESAAKAFASRAVRVVGTPIRPEFLSRASSAAGASHAGASRLLVFGGSQGAKAINTAVIEGLSLLRERVPGLRITHQTGEADHERVMAAYLAAGIQAQVVPFLYDMPRTITEADLVVARSGAMTVAELTACGKPAVLVPLPTAIYDHQMKNARAMEAAGGAIVLPQAALTGAKLAATIAAVLNDPRRLEAMRQGSWGMRRVDAADTIVTECYQLMGRTYDRERALGAGV